MPKKGDLKVWWIPQVPMHPLHPFFVPVDNAVEAVKILKVLAEYDDFQFKNRIKPDYCNAGGLVEYDPAMGETEEDRWTEWYSMEGEDIREYEERLEEEKENASKTNGLNFKGKYMLVREDCIKPEFNTLGDRVLLCCSGFGCNPEAIGTKVFVVNADGSDHDGWWHRHEFEREATPEEVEEAKRQLAERRNNG